MERINLEDLAGWSIRWPCHQLVRGPCDIEDCLAPSNRASHILAAGALASCKRNLGESMQEDPRIGEMEIVKQQPDIS